MCDVKNAHNGSLLSVVTAAHIPHIPSIPLTHPSSLQALGEYDNVWHPLLPNHSPEVTDGVGHRALRCYVALTALVALE